MSEIIRNAERVEIVDHYLVFAWRDDPNAGFSFQCDENGRVDFSAMTPAGRKNFDACIGGEYDVARVGKRAHRRVITEPALLKCDCGRKVELVSPHDNPCQCGRLYNLYGQKLRPMSQWGEETGEQLADIIGPDREAL